MNDDEVMLNDADAVEIVDATETMDISMPKVMGQSPFGMSRKYRRALYSSVRQGKANDQDIEKFRSLGKDAYPWMSFGGEIRRMIRKSLQK